MVKMERVSFVVDAEGKILTTTYEKNSSKLKEYGLGTNALVFAKEMVEKGNKV
jgi:hypothetical protein